MFVKPIQLLSVLSSSKASYSANALASFIRNNIIEACLGTHHVIYEGGGAVLL